jgi:ribonuclease Z
MPAVGYALRENPRLGRFDVDRARALGIPEGPLFGDLHRGESVEVAGRIITPEELVGPPRPGRVVVYTGDSRPCPGTREAATGADLLIHDSTFAEDEVRRAHETFHTTAAGAAALAKEAQAKALILTHISARYSDSIQTLQGEAQEIFPNSRVARDGMVVELPITDDA